MSQTTNLEIVLEIIDATINEILSNWRWFGGRWQIKVNGVNMLKLESYQIDGSFQSTQFYTDLEGHANSDSIKNALDELKYYSEEIKILGVYPSSRK